VRRYLLTFPLLLLIISCGSPPPTTPPPVRPSSLNCGVTDGFFGFNLETPEGEYIGLEADLCRAMALAAFGNTNTLSYTQLTNAGEASYRAVRDGQVDLAMTMQDRTSPRPEIRFASTYFVDGVSFLVRADSEMEGLADLFNQTICMQEGSSAEFVVETTFGAEEIFYIPAVFPEIDDVFEAYRDGFICDVIAAEVSEITALYLPLLNIPEHRILPLRLSEARYAPFVRTNDDFWFEIATLTIGALLRAEELGVTSANVIEQRANSTNPEISNLLGADPAYLEGLGLGLRADAFFRVIADLGNYGELFERNLTPLGMPRGENALTRDGGKLAGRAFR
jgi:general L-amino acid transport system substrate-binding protein